MLSVETKINGALISYLHVVNTGISSPDGVLYKVEYFMPERNPLSLKFEIIHRPEEKAEKLLSLVYANIHKRLEKT